MIYEATYVERMVHTQAIAVLEVNYDDAAERVLIIDRSTLNLLYASSRTSSNTLKVRLPIKYSTKSGLMVMIIDDSLVYQPVVTDSVKCVLEPPYIDLRY